MRIPLRKLPGEGEKVVVTTVDCEVDWIMLEAFKDDELRYTKAIFKNADTEFLLPSGTYRFAFHYQNSAAKAVFKSSVMTPSRDQPFPDEPADGSDTADLGDDGLTEYQVVV